MGDDPTTDSLSELQIQVERATLRLEQLYQQCDDAQVRLAEVRTEVIRADRQLASLQGVEVHEQYQRLVMAERHDRADADLYRKALDAAVMTTDTDVLTELPNRAVLLDRLNTAIVNAKRHGIRAALLFVDLNDFKKINDTLGHDVGDQALRVAASCLASSVREADTVSRYGGDEFLILLAEVGRSEDAVLVADKIVRALSLRSHVGQHTVQLSASIGISIYPDNGADPKTLIDRADAAMYVAKRRGLPAHVSNAESVSASLAARPLPQSDSLPPPGPFQL
ncbi:MAG: GGDEF domain-containing protein [Vicinamibacteria bacterium]